MQKNRFALKPVQALVSVLQLLNKDSKQIIKL